jgi:hypothetical protein
MAYRSCASKGAARSIVVRGIWDEEELVNGEHWPYSTEINPIILTFR